MFAREFTDDIDLEARDPRISRGARRFFGAIGRGIRRVAGAVFGREESEDLLSRDYTFEEDLD